MTPEQFLGTQKNSTSTSLDAFLGDGGFSIVNESPKKGNVVMETLKDIPSDITGSLDEAAAALVEGKNKIVETAKRGFSGKDENPVLTAFETGGAAGRAVSSVAGSAFKGLFKTFLSPSAEKIVKGSVENAATKLMQTDPAQGIAEWYMSLTPDQKRAVNAIEGLAEGLATVFGVGPAGKVAKEAGSIAVETAGKTALGAAKGTAAVGKTAGRVAGQTAAEIQGAYTGTSAETIQQAFSAAKAGGAELQKYTEYLRGQRTPENLVQDVRDATEQLSLKKSQDYAKMLEQIGGETTNTKDIVAGVKTDLARIGVKVNEDGTLNFADSKFRTVPSAQGKLQAMYDEVNRFGNAATVQQIDTSRQALGALLLSGDDNAANTANLAITNAINRVRSAGLEVKGYGDALQKYGDDAEFLNELSRSLSTGDKATVDTAYRKLATTLKTNNEQRMKLLQELDQMTGGYVLSSVAGQQLSEQLPRGLFRQILAGAAGLSAITGGVSMAALPALVLASPRVTGEVIRALGIATSKAEKIIDAFDQARKVLKVEGANYLKNIQPGLSVKSTVEDPSKIAKTMNAGQYKAIKEYLSLKAESANAYIPPKVGTRLYQVLDETGIEKMKGGKQTFSSEQSLIDYLSAIADAYEQSL